MKFRTVLPLQLLLFRRILPDGITAAFRPRAASPSPDLPGQRSTMRAGDRELTALWLELRAAWFPERPDLDDYRVAWSRRPQKRTLASCSPARRRVTVARELQYEEFRRWLRPVLYHELCHASIGEKGEEKTGRRWHGRRFRALERRMAEVRALDDWIKSGGWARAVRSDRARRAYARRAETKRSEAGR